MLRPSRDLSAFVVLHRTDQRSELSKKIFNTLTRRFELFLRGHQSQATRPSLRSRGPVLAPHELISTEVVASESPRQYACPAHPYYVTGTTEKLGSTPASIR